MNGTRDRFEDIVVGGCECSYVMFRRWIQDCVMNGASDKITKLDNDAGLGGDKKDVGEMASGSAASRNTGLGCS